MMRALGVTGAVSVVGLIASIGCASGAREFEEAVGTQSAAIVHGTASGTEHDSVVLLGIGSARGCTGTLVAPNLVLTARHCVTQIDSDGATCKIDGTAYDGGKLYSNYPASSLFVYPGQLASVLVIDPSKASAKGKQLIVETTTTYCNADVAFILLDRAVSAPVAPVRLRDSARAGELVTAVGWGRTEDGRMPAKRLMREGIRVDAIGPYPFDDETGIGLADSEFMIGEAVCSGDSGGPAFASTGAVVGVVSRGGDGDSCIGSDAIGIYTHLAYKRALVDRAFGLAGFAPRDEGTPPGKADGESCSENIDCAANVCVSRVCRMPCTDDSTCEVGEACTTNGDVDVCLPEADRAPPAEDRKDSNGAAPPQPPRTTSGCSAAPTRRSLPNAAAFAVAALLASTLRRRRRA